MKWSANDIKELKTFSGVTFLQDEEHYAYLVNHINEDLSYGSMISLNDNTLLNTKTAAKKLLTFYCGKLYYIQSGQIYCYDLKGNSEKALTNFKVAISYFVVNKDTLYFTSKFNKNLTVLDEDFELHVTDVHINEELDYFSNSEGYLYHEEYNALFSMKIGDNKAKVICDYQLGYGSRNPICINENDELLIERTSDKEKSTKIWFYDAKTEQLKEFVNDTFIKGLQSEPTFSHKGNIIAFVGNNVGYHTSNLNSLYLYDIERNEYTNLSEGLDIHFQDFMVSDTARNNTNRLIQFSEDDKYIFASASVLGRLSILQFDIENKKVVKTIGSDEHISGFTLKNKSMLLINSRPTLISAIDKVDLNTDERVNVTTFSLNRYHSDYEVNYVKNDNFDVQSFLLKPYNYEEGKKYPLIVNIHGGPYTMHGFTFHHEMQIMTSEGYYVLLVNPRGSFGYGQEFLKAVIADCGAGDYIDIMKSVDTVLAKHRDIDEERLFVTGGSYGGYLTNWIISHTDRFKAAATQRCVCNCASQFGTSDIGYYFYLDEYALTELDYEKLWDFSPLKYVKNVKTPCLIVHSKKDYRCSYDQGQQWYTALKFLGVQTRFVLFDEENHELSRNGKIKNRITRLEEIMNWFKRFL